MSRRTWFSLFRTLFGGISSNQSKQALRPNLVLERLEDRAVPASVVYNDTSFLLTIQLDMADESITLTAQGDGNYVFTSNNNFTGDGVPGLTGLNTKTLTITNQLVLTNVSIDNAVTGTSVVFGTSTGSYDDNFSIIFEIAGDIKFTSDTTFDNAENNNLVAMTTGGGVITQTEGTLVVSGSSTFEAIANITLDNANNDFKGVVSFKGGTVEITDKNTLTLGTFASEDLTATSTGMLNLGQGSVGGTLTANSNGGNITQAGPLSIETGTGGILSSINAGAGNITLANGSNNFTGTVSLTGGTVQITGINETTLGTLAIGQDLTVNSLGSLNLGQGSVGGTLTANSINNNITQAGPLSITGTSAINAGAGNITLTDSNNFTGAVTLTGGVTQVTDANALTVILATTGDATLIAGGNLTASGSVSGAGSDLTTTTTNGGTTTFGATTVEVNLSVTSAGAVSQTGALSVTGAATFGAGSGNNITLDTDSNAFSTVTVTSGGNVSLAETGGFTIGGISGIGAGNIGIESSGIVAASGAITTTGTITLNGLATTSSIDIADGSGDVQYASSVFTNLTDGASQIVVGSLTQTGTVTVGGAVSFSDPAVICSAGAGGSITVIENITGTDNASITLSASSTILLNAFIITAGQPIVLDNGSGGATSVVLTSFAALNTTNFGDVTSGAAITITGTVDSDDPFRILSVDAGSSGLISVTGAVGGGFALASLTITNSGGTTFQSSVDAFTVTITDTADTKTVAFQGNLSVVTALTVSGSAGDNYNVSITGSSNSIVGTTSFNNAGTVTIGDGSSDSTTFVGGVTATAPSAINIAGTVAATIGASTITLGDANTAVSVTASATVGGAATGLIDLGDATIADGATLTVGTGIANAINLEAVTGVAGGSASNLTINTTGAVAVSGAVGTDIGTLNIPDSGGTTFQSSVDAAVVIITDTADTKTVAFQGNLSVGTALTITDSGGTTYNVSITGSSNSIAGTTSFNNAGTVTIGDGSSDSTTFTAGVTATAPSAINIAGTVAATTGASTITLGDANTAVSVTASATVGGAATGLIDLGDATIADGATLTVGTGIANAINLEAVTGVAGGSASNLTINTTGAVAVSGAVGTDIGTLNIPDSGGTTFQSSVDAAVVIITDTADTKTVAFQGNLSVGTALTITDSGGTTYNVSITGSSNSIAGTTSFNNAGTVTIGDGSSDSTTFAAGVTATNPSQVNLAGTTSTLDSAISLGDSDTPVTLAQDTTLSAGNATITLGGTVDGANSLTVNTSGATTFSAAVGGGTALASLTTNAGGTTSLKNVTTSGAQNYGDDVTLDGTYATTNNAFSVSGTTTLAGGTTVSTGSGTVGFTGIVDGANSLTVNTSGATTFSAAVGGGTALTSITTDAGGTLAINGGSVKTVGNQTYGDTSVTLGTALTLTTTNNGSITFTGAVNAVGHLVTFNANGTGSVEAKNTGNDFGTVTITGAATQITDTNALTVSLTTTGSTVLSAGGNLVASGSVSGSGSNLTTTTTGTGTTSFGATTVGQNLSVTSVGAVSQTGALGVTGTASFAAGTSNITLDTDSNAFSTVTVTSGANVSLAETGGFTIGGISGIGAGNIGIESSGTVAASGAITTNGTITLNGLATTSSIGIAGGAGDVQYASSVFTNLTDGASQIVVGSLTQTGTVIVGGAVSFSDPAVICSAGAGGSITVNENISGTDNASITLSASPTTILLNHDITTAGQPILLDNGFGGATSVVLGANVTLSSGAGAIDVNGTVDGAFSLTLNSTNSTTLAGAVGGATPLTSITTDAGGTLAINTGSVKTVGNQTYGDTSVTLGTALTLTTANNGSITFTGAVNAVGNLVTFNANGTGSVEAKNTGNDFGTVTITGASDASLADANAFDFGTSFVANDLSLVAVDAVTQSGQITVNGLAAFQTNSNANITFNNAANAFTTAAFAGKTVLVTNSRNISLAGIGSGKDYDGNTVTPSSLDEVATLVTGDLTLKLGSSVLRSADTVFSAGTGVSFVPFRVQGTLAIYSTGQASVMVTEGSRAGGVVFDGRPLDANGNVQLEADPTGLLLYDLDNFLPLVPDNRNANSQGRIIVIGQSLNFDNGSVVLTPSKITTSNDTLSVGAPTLVPGMKVNLTTSQSKFTQASAKTSNQKFVFNNPTAFSANNLTIGSVNPGKTAVVLNQGSKAFDFKGAANYTNPPATPLITLAFQQTLLRVKAVDSGSGDTLFILDNRISKNLVTAGTTFQITNEGNPSANALPTELQGLTDQSFTIQIPNSPENSGDTFETFFLINSSQAKVSVTDDFNIQNVLLYSTGPGSNNRSVAAGPVGKPAGGQAGSSAMGRSGLRAPGDIQRFDVENRSVSSLFVISGQNVDSLDLSVGNAIAFINGPAPGVGSDQYSQTIVNGDVKLGGSLSLVINNADFDPELTRTFTIIDNQGNNPVSGVFDGVPERGIVFAGSQAFTITYKGGDGNDVVLIACNDVPEATGAIVSRPFADNLLPGNVISTIGNAVQFTSPAGVSRQILPFLNTGYKGNLSASGVDRTGDGVTDAIAVGVASANRKTTLRVIDAENGRVAYTLTPFGPNFRGGMRVSAGIADVDGEIQSVIVVGAGPGSTPRVKVFDSVNGQMLKSFNVFGAGYRGGVTVSISTANVNDPATTGRLVVSSLVNPVVKVFDLASGGLGGARLVTSFNPFGNRVVSMVNPSIQIGNLDDDLTTLEIIVGAGFGRNSVQVFDASNGTRLGGINPFPPAYRGGMRVGLADVDRDGILDIVMASSFAPSPAPNLTGFASAIYMLQINGNNDYLFSSIRGAGDDFFNLFTQSQATGDFFLGINPALNRLPGSTR